MAAQRHPEWALYFPYIEIPTDAWFSRVLLYWDKVATTIPEGVLQNRELVSDTTRELVEEELVSAANVGPTALRDPRVEEEFVNHAKRVPFAAFAANAGWLELALLAHDITVWTQQLCLDGAHAICEPKRLRYRTLHVAGRLTRHARRLTLHLPADWPWKAALTRAFERLNALPAFG